MASKIPPSSSKGPQPAGGGEPPKKPPSKLTAFVKRLMGKPVESASTQEMATVKHFSPEPPPGTAGRVDRTAQKAFQMWSGGEDPSRQSLGPREEMQPPRLTGDKLSGRPSHPPGLSMQALHGEDDVKPFKPDYQDPFGETAPAQRRFVPDARRTEEHGDSFETLYTNFWTHVTGLKKNQLPQNRSALREILYTVGILKKISEPALFERDQSMGELENKRAEEAFLHRLDQELQNATSKKTPRAMLAQTLRTAYDKQ